MNVDKAATTIRPKRGIRKPRPDWRAAGSLLDAGTASIGNLAVSFTGARFLNLAEFGVLATLMTTAILLVGIVRVAASDAFTLRYSAADPQHQMDAARRVFGAAALFGVAAAVILLSVGVALAGSSAGSPVVVLGAVIPLLVLQDSARAVSYARGDVGNALTSSSIWTFGTIVGVAALLLGGVFTIELILVVWGLTAGLAMVASAARIRLTPNFRGAVAWMRESRTIAGQSLTDFLLTQAVGHGGGLAIAAVAGSAAYGVLRVAQLPLALTQIVITGAIAFLTPTMVVRVARQNSTAARRLALVGAVAIGSVVTVNGLIVLLLPSEVMTWLLGDGWHASRSLVPIIAATLIASGIAASYGPYLRAVGALSAQVRLKVWTAPTALMLIALGSAVYGAIGGASAQFVSTAVVAGASVYLARFAWAPRAAKQ